jgi:hypothetical protein
VNSVPSRCSVEASPKPQLKKFPENSAANPENGGVWVVARP